MQRKSIFILLMMAASAAAQPSLRDTPEFKDVKVLNNLCWELLSAEAPQGTLTFNMPIDRWVFVRSTAEATNGHVELRIMLDGEEPPMIVHSRGGKLEAMRWLKAGPHTLTFTGRGNGKIAHVIVRAIPALQYALYGESCHIYPYGRYDWAFLKKDVLPNVNVMISNRHVAPAPAHIGAWKADGRRWMDEATAAWHMTRRDEKGRLHFKDDVKKPGEAVYQYWTERSWAVRHPLVDGLIIDEIITSVRPMFGAFGEAAEKLYANPKFAGKTFDLYVAGPSLYDNKEGVALARQCVQGGGMIADEWYLQELPDGKAAQQKIDDTFARKMRVWEAAHPGITPSIVAALANESAPPENSDRYPGVDFNVFMQMQMQKIASDPALFGLGGIQWYKSGYADEEVIRLGGRLFRHYCIEGNTQPLTNDPYDLPHLTNPDFVAGLNGWQVTGDVAGAQYKGYGVLQGRWGRGMGDTFAVMQRDASISQPIAALQPGRLYCLKMFTSDYADLLAGKSDKKKSPVSITIDNVEVLDHPSKTFQFTFPHSYGDKRDKFEPSAPYWLNLHRVIFRARTTSSQLTISGGPAMVNYVQLQPYHD